MARKGNEAAAEDDGGEQVVKGIDSLRFRKSPSFFAGTVTFLNAKQKKAVIELGFGALLHFTLEHLPPKLSYWVASHYYPFSSSLPISPGVGGQHVDEEDVHLTFGFPKGTAMMERHVGTHLGIMEELATAEDKERRHLNIDDIRKHMLLDEEGEDHFKKLFLIVLGYCLIETPTDGFVRPKILKMAIERGIGRAIKHGGWK